MRRRVPVAGIKARRAWPPGNVGRGETQWCVRELRQFKHKPVKLAA